MHGVALEGRGGASLARHAWRGTSGRKSGGGRCEPEATITPSHHHTMLSPLTMYFLPSTRPMRDSHFPCWWWRVTPR